ncbi:hypothetical protein [Chitinophaga flava]|uniref:hypothetical protein n=1 Tax=Chitinophaga flava TaxID=2259036 RepID=UPI000DE573D7|nr:hypothetical protein [Chitinophaga flava]
MKWNITPLASFCAVRENKQQWCILYGIPFSIKAKKENIVKAVDTFTGTIQYLKQQVVKRPPNEKGLRRKTAESLLV